MSLVDEVIPGYSTGHFRILTNKRCYMCQILLYGTYKKMFPLLGVDSLLNSLEIIAIVYNSEDSSVNGLVIDILCSYFAVFCYNREWPRTRQENIC